MTVRSLCLAFFVFTACAPGGDPPAEAGSGTGERAEAPAEGSAAASEAESESAQAAAEGSAADGAPRVPAPPPLERLMRDLGYDDPSEAQLAEFVPVPPGATGEAGVFGRGEQTVRVALLRYPNARFAGPHIRDLEERRALLPGGGEAVLARDRFVVHVEALDRAGADALVERLRERLGW